MTTAPDPGNEPFMPITSCGGLTFTSSTYTASAKIKRSYMHMVIGNLLVDWDGRSSLQVEKEE